MNFDNAFEPGAREKKEESLPQEAGVAIHKDRAPPAALAKKPKVICALLSISKYPHWKEKKETTVYRHHPILHTPTWCKNAYYKL